MSCYVICVFFLYCFLLLYYELTLMTCTPRTMGIMLPPRIIYFVGFFYLHVISSRNAPIFGSNLSNVGVVAPAHIIIPFGL